MNLFDNDYINKKIHDYLYGKYYPYSSMKTTLINNDNYSMEKLSKAIKQYNVPHVRILINENQCSETLLNNMNNKDKIITFSNFLDEALNSHVCDRNPKHAIHSIDLRECQIDNKEFENIINNSSEKVKILITNSETSGKHTEKYLKDNFDELIFLGKHDEKIINKMRKILGNDYVVAKYQDIDNIEKQLYNHNPKLFIKTITQGETIDLISNEEKYGKVAFVSADVEFGDRLPEASGGNYCYNIYDLQTSTFSNLKDNKITSKFFDMMVENKVDSVIFTCCHSNSRGPYFAQLFMNQCREKNHQLNIYVMYPGVGRIHDDKYKNRDYVEAIDLDKLFK
jgi:hypothetical protein